MWNWLKNLFKKKEEKHLYITSIPKYGDKGDDVGKLQDALRAKGYSIIGPKTFGPKTKAAVAAFQKSWGSIGTGALGPITIEKLGLKIAEPKPVTGIPPEYPAPHRFHPRFNVKPPYTHAHPLDVARSVEGEKEIPGSRHNAFIAHLHEHSGNLGSHSEGADYSDEVPHCASGMNWSADMAGCEKTNNALAASWKKYNVEREGDWVEEGDIITIGTSHVTMCNKRFNRRTAKTFEGFGFNQGNSIKASKYKVSSISSVRVWKPKPGTVLAPVGTRPSIVGGKIGESTR